MEKRILEVVMFFISLFVCLLVPGYGGYLISKVEYTNKYKKKIKEQIEVVDSIKGELQNVLIENESYKSSLANSDSLKVENFILKYKINRIKQYDSIIIRNSSQSKYFRGWVRRVIYE